ncbi:hypothetical protein P3T73_07815 [Kiritimatiellota bacterium B12222]|nr:hypothetical protein P3T73_07815 [Kiritimatiellota bacterium B12222]
MNTRLLLCLSALFISPVAIHADVIYATTFPEATNTAPTGWTVLIGGTGSTTSNGWFIDAAQEYRYSQGNSTGGVSSYTGAVSGGFDATDLSDVTVEATFRKATNGYYAGLIGRGTGTNTFYHTRLAGNDFQLYRANDGTFTPLGSTVTLTGGDIYPGGVAYRMSLSMQGTQITAQLFDEFDSEVGMITVNDNGVDALSSGYTGVRAQSPTVYETYQITAIPEPTSAILVLIGLSLLPFTLRRQRSRH